MGGKSFHGPLRIEDVEEAGEAFRGLGREATGGTDEIDCNLAGGSKEACRLATSCGALDGSSIVTRFFCFVSARFAATDVVC